MRTLRWSNDALDEFDRALSYISKDNPSAAMMVAERIDDAAQKLTSIPTGRIGRVEGTYEKSVHNTNYIIAYGMTDTEIVILRIIHTSRNWPPNAWPKD